MRPQSNATQSKDHLDFDYHKMPYCQILLHIMVRLANRYLFLHTLPSSCVISVSKPCRYPHFDLLMFPADRLL
jgi:hypothetical protein